MINHLGVGPARFEIDGWALPPRNPENAAFTINGSTFPNVVYPTPTDSLAETFWQRANAGRSGYRCWIDGDGESLFKDGHVTLGFAYPGQPVRFWFHSAWFFRDPHLEGPLPSGERITRVIGTDDAQMYCLGGFTDFTRMRLLLQGLLGRDFVDFPRILDWGCGAGRVARYFSTVPQVALSGADVDPDNIAWCRENLRFGEFRALPLLPPTDFAAESFDLIFGISVFTHLREDAQLAWLAELKRIAAPGAIVLATFHGRTVLDYAGLPRSICIDLLGRIEAEGMLVGGGNSQISDVIDDPDYYVHVFHAEWYVRERWGEHFEIVDIIPGFLYTHDLVVMRKRSS